MGADVYGWVETRERDYEGAGWESAIRIRDIVHRSYSMFAGLFGVRNYLVRDRLPRPDYYNVVAVGQFRAIAPGRGAPLQASRWYVEERDDYGGPVAETWALWSELAAIDWDEEGEIYIAEDPSHVISILPGLGRRRMRRRDSLYGGWATLFKLMEVLAEQFGPDNVRLSVWFDQW